MLAQSQHRVSYTGSADSRTRSAELDSHHQRRTHKPHRPPHSRSTRAKSYSGLAMTMYEHKMTNTHARRVLTLAIGTNNILLRTGRAEWCWSAKIYIISGTYTTRRTSQADTTLRQGCSVSISQECSSVESERSYTMAFDVSCAMMLQSELPSNDKYQTRRVQGPTMYVFLVKRHLRATGCWLPRQDVQG